MRKAERALVIKRYLSRKYPQPSPPLRHKNPYTLLICVLLSARCTDKRVNAVSPSLFALADTPEAMQNLSVGRVQKIIRPCGLSPQKAKAIVGLSRILMREHGGAVPQDLDALEALPGVGHKTASVVLSQAFGVPAFPVDTHIHRLAQRWGLSDGRSVTQTERDLKALFPKASWSKLHLQIIYYAREFCTAYNCDGTVCFLCRKLFPRRKKAVQTRSA